MPWTDWKFPTSTNERGAALESWTAANDVRTDDGNLANVNVKSRASQYLMGSAHGLTASDVPADTIIVAVQVETEIKAWDGAGTGGVHTFYVGLHNDTSVAPSDTGRQTGTYTVDSTTEGGASFQVDTFTGLFGQSLTQTIVTGTNFGAWIQAAGGTQTSNDEEFGIDYMRLRVLWEYPGSGLIGDI